MNIEKLVEISKHIFQQYCTQRHGQFQPIFQSLHTLELPSVCCKKLLQEKEFAQGRQH